MIKKFEEFTSLSESYESDHYEGKRYSKMHRTDFESYDFVHSMEDKIKEILPEVDIEKIEQECSTATDNIFNYIKEMQETLAMHIGIFYNAYKETGDERFLVAAKGKINLCQEEIYKSINNLNKNSNVKIKFTFDFDNKTLNDYTPLSKDKVYHHDTETKLDYSRLANVKDRKNGTNGTFGE